MPETFTFDRGEQKELQRPYTVRLPLRGTPAPMEDRSRVWELSGAPAEHLVRALQRFDDPGPTSPLPWTAVVLRDDGSLVLAASSSSESGVFWTVEQGTDGRITLLCGPDLGAVVELRTAVTELSGSFLRSQLARFPVPTSATPYIDVHTLRPGTTAVWRPGHLTPRVVRWLSPEVLPSPTVEGPGTKERYLRTFDAAVDAMLAPGEPICSTLSGGLDSTFLVASLVRHATPDNPIHCFTHSPHPEAGAVPMANWDPDDYDIARAMERAYPGLVTITRFINEPPVDPLDVLTWGGERAWTPIMSVNASWFAPMAARARALGASQLFLGSNGNAAFSSTHAYAAAYYLRQGNVGSVAGLANPRTGHGLRIPQAVKSGILGPLTAPLRHRRAATLNERYLPLVGLGHLTPAAPRSSWAASDGSREGFLRWLVGADDQAIIVSPRTWPVVRVDPFRARSVVELAAAITPRQWRCGPYPRGYARVLGEGRVPDEIRLRTRRGSQSADLWFAMQGHRDRYLDELAMVPDTRFLGGWVDAEQLRRSVEKWPWGQPRGPGYGVLGLLAVLEMAAFIRMTERRLRRLPAAGSDRTGL